MNATNNEMFKLRDTQQATLNKALQMLRALTAAGVQYAVVLPDGTKHGDLNVIPPKKEKDCKFKKTGYNYQPIYKDAFDKMQPGDVVVLNLPPDAPKHITNTMLSSALAGAGHWKWGKGSVTVAQTKDRKAVEVMRIY